MDPPQHIEPGASCASWCQQGHSNRAGWVRLFEDGLRRSVWRLHDRAARGLAGRAQTERTAGDPQAGTTTETNLERLRRECRHTAGSSVGFIATAEGITGTLARAVGGFPGAWWVAMPTACWCADTRRYQRPSVRGAGYQPQGRRNRPLAR